MITTVKQTYNHVAKLGREPATRPNFYNTMLTEYASFEKDDHSGEGAKRPTLAPVELEMGGKHRKSSWVPFALRCRREQTDPIINS